MSKFQQRHYNALAEFVHNNFDENSTLCDKLADFFEEDNSKFSRDLWVRACRHGERVHPRQRRD